MEELPWFGALPPDQRAYVGLVVQNGVAAFAQWLRAPAASVPADPKVFAAAPRELARAVSLKQTVQLIRVAVGVIEQAVPSLASRGGCEHRARDYGERHSPSRCRGRASETHLASGGCNRDEAQALMTGMQPKKPRRNGRQTAHDSLPTSGRPGTAPPAATRR